MLFRLRLHLGGQILSFHLYEEHYAQTTLGPAEYAYLEEAG